MTEPMTDQLDAQARDVLARYKSELGPAPDDVSASWQAIAAQASVEGEAVVAARERRTVARRGFAAGVIVATAAAAVLVLWMQPWGSSATSDPERLGAAQYEERDRSEGGRAVAREPVPSRARPDRARSAAVENMDEPDLEPELEPDLVIEDDEPEVQARRTERRPAVDPIEALKQESALLHRARSALSSGRARDALARVAEHGRRFPRGTMAEEAAAIRVGALCDVGPAKRWRKALAGFDRRYPKSPLRVHLRDDCFAD